MLVFRYVLFYNHYDRGMMIISIYGVGYVGLVTGVCFANTGHHVICCDLDQEKIKKLKQGINVLFEPHFDKMLVDASAKGTIEFTSDLEKTIAVSHIHLLCVGTPSGIDGSANLTYLFQAIENLTSHVQEAFIVVIKSTVEVGTAQRVKIKIEEELAKQGKKIPFHVVSCPEFLAEGSAVQNFLHPDRIVIGTDSESAFETIKELYMSSIKSPNTPVIHMSNASAELTKYAANLFLATKISYMNEISRIAELVGANISDTIRGMISDKRIGPAMSNPGPGFGGSCLPKDLKALIHQSEKHNYDPLLLKSVLKINEDQKRYFIGKVFSLCDFNVKNKTIAIWGLAFKSNTDDLRESISCDLVEALVKADAIVQAYDPAAATQAQTKFCQYSNFKICTSKELAIHNADLLVVMTEWEEFYPLDINMLKHSMNKLLLVDGRLMYDPTPLREQGISYFSIGRGFLPAK